MRLRLLRSAWGLPQFRSGDCRQTMARLRGQGWHGLEASLHDIGATASERRECLMAAQAEGLHVIMSAYSSWQNYDGPFEDRTVQEHGDGLHAQIREIAELNASLSGPSPLLRVNAHSGSDAWSEPEAVAFFERAVGDACGLDVSHETHRGRYLCCPFATARLLEKVPSLRLTSDFSHWVVKCERLLDSNAEHALLRSALAPAVDHLHARIGMPQSPQVADVEHSSVARSAERFYSWWEAVWTAREARSVSGRDAVLTATIEYGPVEISDAGGTEYCGYTPVDLALEPVAKVELETTLDRARQRLEERFERWHADSPQRRIMT